MTAGDFDVFEVMRAVATENGLLVAFAEEEHNIAWAGEGEGFLDCGGAVHDLIEVAVHDFAVFRGALDEAGSDSLGVFVARVIFGNDDNVRVLGEDGAADGASRRVTAAGASVDRDDAPLDFAEAVKNFLESVGSMSVVNNDGEGLTFVNEVHAAFDTGEGSDAAGDLVIGEAEVTADEGGSKGIIDIELARNLSRE